MIKKFTNLYARFFAIVIIVPLFMLLISDFEGQNIKDAIHSSLNTLFQAPYAYFSWSILIVINVIAFAFVKPIFIFWIKHNKNQVVSDNEKDAAMCAFNGYKKLIVLLSVIGFSLGTSLAYVFGMNISFDTMPTFYILTESMVTALLTATIINMSLENVLFPVKRALILENPSVTPKYVSFYKHLFSTIMLLLAFLGFQIFEISTNLYFTAIVNSKDFSELIPENTSQLLPEYFFSHIGAIHKATGEILKVLNVKLILFLVISVRSIALIKSALKNPMDTIQNRLAKLSSTANTVQKPITIVNNNEFSKIYEDLNTLIIRQQEQITTSRERLYSVIDDAADPIISFKENGELFLFNPAAEKYFGWSKDEIAGKTLLTLFDKESDTVKKCDYSIIKMIEAMEKNQLKRFNGCNKSGDTLQFEGNISFAETEDGKIYTAVLRDIKQQLDFEESLKTAKLAAEKANRLKSEFLANMSHELRTPLNAVLGYTQLLNNDKNLTSDQIKKIKTISNSGEHLLALINDILDISKIEAGKIELHESAVNVRDFVDDFRDMFELKCKKKGLTLYVEFVDPLPEIIACDVGKLRQILINIVGNAIKFTSEGGISIVVGIVNNQLQFSISDTGKGIPESEIATIIQPFTQSSLIDHEGGTGLGLAITNSFISMMGGNMHIESELNKGSTFTFAVDISEANEVIEDSNVEEKHVIGIKDNRHPKVLVVDDKINNRLILKEMLEQVGFIAMEAENGKEAIDRAEDFQPELIFMDIKMPVMDGYEAVSQLKAHDNLKTIPVFALTASAFKHDEASILSSGFDGFLAKPFKLPALFSLIEQNSDIEFIAEDNEHILETPDISELNINQISASISNLQMNELQDLALINDFNGIKTYIDKEFTDPDLKDLQRVIRQVCDNFDDSGMEEILEKIKEAKNG